MEGPNAAVNRSHNKKIGAGRMFEKPLKMRVCLRHRNLCVPSLVKRDLSLGMLVDIFADSATGAHQNAKRRGESGDFLILEAFVACDRN